MLDICSGIKPKTIMKKVRTVKNKSNFSGYLVVLLANIKSIGTMTNIKFESKRYVITTPILKTDTPSELTFSANLCISKRRKLKP